MFSEVYDTLHLRVLWHLYESQGCFYHRGDRSSEDWICGVIEFIVEIAQGKVNTLGSSGPAFSPALISCSACCLSSFIFVLWGILGQIIILDLIWSFIRVMLAGSTPILLVDHRDQFFWSLAFKVQSIIG